MFTIYYDPHPVLQEFVETICIIKHDFSMSNALSSVYTFMPTHTRFLCFYLDDTVMVKIGNGSFEERSRAMIIGPQTKPVTLNLRKKHTNLIVILKPGGLYRLLGIPLREIVDCDFDARLILGKEITSVLEQLMNTLGNEERNKIIQDYLVSKLIYLKSERIIDLAMLQLVKTQGNLSMDFLASQACLSVRQLERQSLERIGLSPKYFARMVRFSEAYKFKERNPHCSWSAICYRFGYFDQMHLIRDFKSFTGIKPSNIKEDDIVKSVKFNSLDI